MARPGVAILGAGRMGQGLALALERGGRGAILLSRTSHPVIPPLRLHPGPRATALSEAELILLAVPDGAISSVATELATERAVLARHVVLHLSGLRDREALAPLAPTGAALGSFHPLQTVADPLTAPERFAGAYAGVEGDSRALAAAEALAATLGMTAVPIPAGAKPAYHAGATFAANYTTALAAVAERLAASAGVAPDVARRLYLPLIRGAAANLDVGPSSALTGPVRRGDAETVRAHLRVLAPTDRRLYLLLAREALRLAGEAGLPPAARAEVSRALDEGELEG
ncbi:MAG TPA: Rossmann-like and DUF2520 domain-containing protein [Gemmatimonadales bacterium]|nr:Rossmann-like and DUF2520 domain-containing protein [Gemmatimonadales bacterium]